MDQLSALASELSYRPELKRYRDLHIYRGMSNADFKLTTSLYRNCKSMSRELEMPLLHNFTKYAVLEEPIIDGNVWKQMIVGQHHGFPTRLLDWSFSPLMAMHFATTEQDLDKMDAHDAVIWRIDVHELHDRLPDKYQQIMKKYSTTVFSVDMLREACESLEQYDKDMKDQAMVIIEPPSTNDRIINEYVHEIQRLYIEHGSLFPSPIVVYKMAHGGYLILNGHHRWAASIKCGLKKVRATIMNPPK